MTLTSYAQNFEDVLLWRALGHIADGTYIDVGAQDPVTDSVSLCFYQAGWRGISVEPTTAYAAKLRAARPDEIVLEAAVSAQSAPLALFEIPDTGLSTAAKCIADRHREAGYPLREILVPTVSLADLLDMRTDVHWLKIDVEGTESDVIESWRDQPSRPWIVVVEATAPNSQEPTHQAWRDDVLRRDYKEVHFDGLSRYFVHQAHAELASAFEAPPNVFDDFQITHSHFSATTLRHDLEQVRQAAQSREAVCQQQGADLAKSQAELAVTIADKQRLATELSTARDALLGEQTRAASERAELTTALQLTISSEREHVSALEHAWQERLRLAHQASQQQLLSERTELARELEKTNEALSALMQRSADQQQTSVAQLLELQEQLDAAQRCIDQALASPDNGWQRLGQKLGLARKNPVAQALRACSPAPPYQRQTVTAGSEPDMYFAPSSLGGNPYLRANSLPELLSWNDLDFVRCAYVTVLGRQPDPDGERYYANRLALGHSKLEVLWQLRRSSEGPRHDPGIAGLDRTLKKARWARLPLIGVFVRLITSDHEEGRAARRLRILTYDIIARLNYPNEVHSKLLASSYQIEGRLEDLAKKVEDLHTRRTRAAKSDMSSSTRAVYELLRTQDVSEHAV